MTWRKSGGFWRVRQIDRCLILAIRTGDPTRQESTLSPPKLLHILPNLWFGGGQCLSPVEGRGGRFPLEVGTQVKGRVWLSGLEKGPRKGAGITCVGDAGYDWRHLGLHSIKWGQVQDYNDDAGAIGMRLDFAAM